MKLGNRLKLEPSVEVVVIPRSMADGSKEDIVFKMKTVLDWDAFDKLCPVPIAPRITRAGANANDPAEFDVENADFKLKLMEHGNNRVNWIIIQSLTATENLEWQNVKLNEPKTWKLYTEELKEFGLSPFEINQIVESVFKANGLSDRILEEAKTRFLAGKGNQQLPQTGRSTGN